MISQLCQYGLIFFRWNNTPLDDAISHQSSNVVDLLRDHIEEWDQMSNHDIGDEYTQNSINGDDTMIRAIKEKLHGISPDVRKYEIINAQ